MFGKSKEEKEADDLREKRRVSCVLIETFANIGDTIEYLNVSMTVTGYHEVGLRAGRYFPMIHITPSLNVEWMSKNNELQRMKIYENKLQFCKNITRN